ncbi:hypothetical protein [Streptomyces sp. NPDC058486]|uniref:hypothetical protein n=1 Tax=unclassified Streptomyces TaxID=2593676 RepID=UPI00365729DB
MMFEGHIDRAPCLLPRRERGEALFATRAATQGPSNPARIDFFAVLADQGRGAGSDLASRLFLVPAPGSTALKSGNGLSRGSE